MKPIIFLHVPKTAGTTLHSIIGLNYPNHQLFFTSPDSERPWTEVERLTPNQRERIKLYTGHFAFGLHKVLGEDATYITVLRDPIDRTLSEYFHIKRDPTHGLHAFVSSGQMGLDAYLLHLKARGIDNNQTRLFSGEWLNSDHLTPCTEQMLTEAKHNLQTHFAVVGMTEHFDVTLLLLQRAFGWKHLLYKNRNTTANRPTETSLTPDERAVLDQHNEYDTQLYAFAKDLFTKQIADYGTTFHNHLKALRARQNASLAPLNRKLAQLTMSTRNVLHRLGL